jgi:catechol 2,3-dioxygenase-like lactoylglutathione lyase family enzyme
MRLILALILMASASYAADLRIDHVTLAGQSLDSMREAFTAATGIRTEYGGSHANHVTEMALASFQDGSYIELMGIQGGADPAAVAAHTWGQFLRNDGGPCAFALRVSDVTAEVELLKKAGLHVGKAERSGRTRPDGVALAWETADVGPGPRGSLFPFLIRDLTPREKRVYPSGAPTEKRLGGIGLVVIGVSNIDEAIAQYCKAFGLPAPKRQRDETFGADLAWFESTPVVLAMGTRPGTWLTKRTAQFGDAPCAFVLKATSRMNDQKFPRQRSSTWFGRSIFWASDVKLAGRLGMWVPQ